MRCIAACTLAVALSAGLHAQTPATRSAPDGSRSEAPTPFGHVAIGPTSSGVAGIVELGLNRGEVTPQIFGAVAVPTGASRTIGVGETDERFRATLAGGARVALGSPLKRLDVAASMGGGVSTARGVSVAFGAPGQTTVDINQRRSLWQVGAVGTLGFEATQWVTDRVGLSISAHQTIGLPFLYRTDSERYRVDPGSQSDSAFATVSAPRLEQTFVGVGVRIGRQQRVGP